jgi:hypothetical protein
MSSNDSYTLVSDGLRTFFSLWKEADPGIAEVEDARERLTGLR